jgi:hypothetical protein
MSRRLFVVEDTFTITGRGLVLVPGIIPEGEERFRAGDPILLKRPEGSSLTCKIGALEILMRVPPDRKRDVVIMLKERRKEDVPIGTEVWSVDPS